MSLGIIHVDDYAYDYVDVQVPGAKKITCVAFGGRDLDILFITSARCSP